MGTGVFVGNLPLSATEAALARRFGKFGIVLSVRLEEASHPAETQRRAVVEMQTPFQAQRAVNALNLCDYEGRVIFVYKPVAVARPREIMLRRLRRSRL